MKPQQKAMIYKDIKEVTGSSQMLLPMIIVPLIMMVIFPVALMIGAQFGVSGMNGMDALIKRFSGILTYENNSQLLVELGVNYMFPPLFLLIPIMTSSILGANSFVGEKEHKTMESLLYTPMSIKELFTVKVLSTAIPAYAVAMLSFVVFGIIVNIGGWFYFGKLIFPNLKWILLVIWVTPAITILGIFFMVLISAKANTFQEAQQMSAFIIIPVILLFIGQTTGLFLLNNFILIGFGAIIYLIDFLLVKNAASKFVPEKLI